MKAYHGTTDGRFNLCGNEKSTQVYLYTPAGNFSELWPIGEAPYDRDMLPSEVLDIIEERLKSHLYISSREENLKRIAAAREQMTDFDLAWLRARVDVAREELTRWILRLADHSPSEAATKETP